MIGGISPLIISDVLSQKDESDERRMLPQAVALSNRAVTKPFSWWSYYISLRKFAKFIADRQLMIIDFGVSVQLKNMKI